MVVTAEFGFRISLTVKGAVKMHRCNIKCKLNSSEMTLHCYRIMLSATALFYCFHYHHHRHHHQHHNHSHSAILNFIKTRQAVFPAKNEDRKAGGRTRTTLYDFILCTSYKNVQHIRVIRCFFDRASQYRIISLTNFNAQFFIH